jgi:hypothetical protein
MDPGEWVNLGIEKLNNGSTISRSFEELLDMYYNPDRGDVVSSTAIINASNLMNNKIISIHMSG